MGFDYTKQLGEQFQIYSFEVYAMVRVENDFVTYLKTQGYSDRAIAEICKWYICSTTKISSGKLPPELKN